MKGFDPTSLSCKSEKGYFALNQSPFIVAKHRATILGVQQIIAGLSSAIALHHPTVEGVPSTIERYQPSVASELRRHRAHGHDLTKSALSMRGQVPRVEQRAGHRSRFVHITLPGRRISRHISDNQTI
jgi:hypothetical protein